MKRASRLFATLLLAVMLVGCSSGVSQEEYDKLKGEYDAVSQELEELKKIQSVPDSNMEDIGEYKYAEFKKYNSFASENGLSGDNIYVIGTFKEVKNFDELVYIYLRQPDEYEWLASLGLINNFDSEKFNNLFKEKEITVCGTYGGFSVVEQRPALYVSKIICDGKEYPISEYNIYDSQTSTESNLSTVTTKPESEQPNSPKISKAEFDKIQNGMSYQEVVDIIGGSGELIAETDLELGSEYITKMYQWTGEGQMGSNANIMLQGGKVTTKAQYGLE